MTTMRLTTVVVFVVFFLAASTNAFQSQLVRQQQRSLLAVPKSSPSILFPSSHHQQHQTRLFNSAASIPLSSSSDGSSSSSSGSAASKVSGGSATIPQEIFNLVKSIVGAGVLALPAGIASFGNAPSAVIPASALIAGIGGLSAYGFCLIGRVCSLTGTSTYRQAWEASVNPETSWIPAWSVTLKTICATLAYSMILGDTFTHLAQSAGFLGAAPTPTLLIVTLVCLLPLCLMKNLSSLAPFSLLGTLGMLYTAFTMMVRYVNKDYAIGGAFASSLAPNLQPRFGSVGASGALSPKVSILLGMLSTAYMAHFNAPKFYVELKNNTIKRYATVVASSFAISVFIFAAMAGFGFLTFGAASSGLILNNYAATDLLMSWSRLAVAVSLVFSYPLAFVGARDGILDLLKLTGKTSSMQLNLISVALLSGLTVGALIIPDVSFILAMAGATLGNALIYVYPGIMWRGAVRRAAKAGKDMTKQTREVRFALGSTLFGICMGAMGVVKTIQSVM